MDDYRLEAERFLTQETQFHLGMLPTEQSHPLTRGLAETLQADTAAGVRLLQRVDQDVVVMARRVFGSAEYTALVAALTETIAAGGRVCFSGCGATGRLSILLEAMWRWLWREVVEADVSLAQLALRWADRLVSIMTGGDFALIRSVEGFEDYISFGRHQVVELGLGAGDTLVAISEGGETSSVIGTVLEARERGAHCFFAFNNPPEIMAQHLERSRRVIEDPQVTVLNLTTGPMAVAGSTRMQATTAELLVVGQALEDAFVRLLRGALPAAVIDTLPIEALTPGDPLQRLEKLLTDLSSPFAVAALSDWVELEHEIYAAGGRVTYFAGECLLDIFTDTTERSPTFMLPPFRKCDDEVSPPSWAFVKDPLRSTEGAWLHLLGRQPRCLDWDVPRYEQLGAAERLLTNPPSLSRADLLKFRIGCEPDSSRTAVAPSVALAVLLAPEASGPRAAAWQERFEAQTADFTRKHRVLIGPGSSDGEALRLPCQLPVSPFGLWRRLATKLVLNTVSTATAGKLGRLVSNWMANVDCSNKKLIDRGTRLVAELAGVDYETACVELHRTIATQQADPQPGQERISPVAETIARLGRV